MSKDENSIQLTLHCQGEKDLIQSLLYTHTNQVKWHLQMSTCGTLANILLIPIEVSLLVIFYKILSLGGSGKSHLLCGLVQQLHQSTMSLKK